MTYEELRAILEKYVYFTCDIQREQTIKAMMEAVERATVNSFTLEPHKGVTIGSNYSDRVTKHTIQYDDNN